MSNKIYVTWEEVFSSLRLIDKAINTVYGVPKGGMVASAFLKQAQVTHDPEKANVILEDIIDSGTTKAKYDRYGKPFYAIVDKSSMEPGNPNKDAWYVFPWEAEHPGGEESVEDNIIRQFQYIGEDSSREGLKDTPKRVVKMWNEIFKGYNLENKPSVSIFKNGNDGIVYDEMIIDKGDFYSHCEHHMVPFFGRYWFGYIPSPVGGIIGLSKVARIVDFHSSKLQIQERLVHDIVEDIWNVLCDGYAAPLGMGLVMEAEHLCKTMRGIKKKGSMRTTKLKGVFKTLPETREEFLNVVK